MCWTFSGFTRPDATLHQDLWHCMGFTGPHMCCIKGYWGAMFMCLAVMLSPFCGTVLLSLSYPPSFCHQPALHAQPLISKEASLSLSPAPWSNVFLSFSQNPRAKLLCSQRENLSFIFGMEIIPQGSWGAPALPLLYELVLGALASFGSLEGLDVSSRKRKVPSWHPVG